MKKHFERKLRGKWIYPGMRKGINDVLKAVKIIILTASTYFTSIMVMFGFVSVFFIQQGNLFVMAERKIGVGQKVFAYIILGAFIYTLTLGFIRNRQRGFKHVIMSVWASVMCYLVSYVYVRWYGLSYTFVDSINIVLAICIICASFMVLGLCIRSVRRVFAVCKELVKEFHEMQ